MVVERLVVGGKLEILCVSNLLQMDSAKSDRSLVLDPSVSVCNMLHYIAVRVLRHSCLKDEILTQHNNRTVFLNSHLWLLKNNQKPSVDLNFLVESSGLKKNPKVCLAETPGNSLPTKSAHGLDSFILLFVLKRTTERPSRPGTSS